MEEESETGEEALGFERVPSRSVFTESGSWQDRCSFTLGFVCLLSLYDAVVPNVWLHRAEGGVHCTLRFPAIFVKWDLTLIFYCK